MAKAALSFEKVETGRTHNTRDGVAPITNADGDAEYEYVLFATIDGVRVPILTKNAGYIEHLRDVAQAQKDADAGDEPDEADDPAS